MLQSMMMVLAVVQLQLSCSAVTSIGDARRIVLCLARAVVGSSYWGRRVTQASRWATTASEWCYCCAALKKRSDWRKWSDYGQRVMLPLLCSRMCVQSPWRSWVTKASKWCYRCCVVALMHLSSEGQQSHCIKEVEQLRLSCCLASDWSSGTISGKELMLSSLCRHFEEV